MNAYVARPADGAPRPGLMVFQEAFGVNAHIRDVTERCARSGVVAIAPELFHRTAAGFEAAYTDFPATVPHMRAMTVEGLTQDIRAAYDWLQGDPQVRKDAIASIGFLHVGGMLRSIVFGERDGTFAGGDFVLWRRDCAIAVAAGGELARDDAIFLGRAR